jgi:hypothetical protein
MRQKQKKTVIYNKNYSQLDLDCLKFELKSYLGSMIKHDLKRSNMIWCLELKILQKFTENECDTIKNH